MPDQQKGFTLIELLTVISIIALLSVIALVVVSYAAARARDTKRAADIAQIKKAFLLFYNDHERYPDWLNDGVDRWGEVLGDNNGPLEQALAPYMPLVPADPKWNGEITDTSFFYIYDPEHNGCRVSPSIGTPVLSIHRFETSAGQNEFGQRDTKVGTDSRIATAQHAYCFMNYD